MKVSNWVLAPLLAAFTGCVINPVTGNRELALVSADQEVAIGEQQYAPSRQMQGGDYALDPGLTTYVRGVGQKLAAVSDRELPYEFVVLNSSVPNAWALPGGKIAVNRGLLTELHSEAELAAVLGHEIVHAAARHGALAMQRGLLLQGALLATAVITQRDHDPGLADRRRERWRAADHAAQQPRSRARVRSLRHDLHVARRIRPAGGRHAPGDVRAACGAERRRGWQARGAVRESSPLHRARREEPRDGDDAANRRRHRARALPSRDRDAAATRARPTRRTTMRAWLSARRNRTKPSVSRNKP